MGVIPDICLENVPKVKDIVIPDAPKKVVPKVVPNKGKGMYYNPPQKTTKRIRSTTSLQQGRLSKTTIRSTTSLQQGRIPKRIRSIRSTTSLQQGRLPKRIRSTTSLQQGRLPTKQQRILPIRTRCLLGHL